MNDYLKIISDLLTANEKVIVFSVGGDTLNILRGLQIKYNILPTAVCDNDPDKQSKTYNGLFGLTVVSPKEANEKYPGAFWFVSSLQYKFQIIGQLVNDFEIRPEKIINYEPVIKKKSCLYFEQSLVCDEFKRLCFCCFPQGADTYVYYNGSYNESLGDFIKLRDRLIDDYKNECGECGFYKEDYYPAERKIRWINYSAGGICNFKCIYCSTKAKNAENSDENVPSFPEVIRYFRDNDILSDEFGTNIAPGEPTVHPERNEIFDTMDFRSNIVNTNLFVFNDKLYDLMKNKFTKLVVSIDCGTKETFIKVKGRDCFDKVCEHLKKYADAGIGIIMLKYVFVPGANDSFEDVDGFVDIMLKTGCLIANISYDYGSPLPIPEKTAAAMRRLRTRLAENRILCTQNVIYAPSDYVNELKKSVN